MASASIASDMSIRMFPARAWPIIMVAGPPKCSARIYTLVSSVALITVWLDSMAALSPGFCNQTVDVRLFDAECLNSLRTVVQQFRPRTLFDIPPRSIGEHFIDAAVFRLRRTLNFRQQGFRK